MSHSIEVYRLRDADDDLSLDVYDWSNDCTGAIAVIDVVIPNERTLQVELTEGMAEELAEFLLKLVAAERRRRKRLRAWKRKKGIATCPPPTSSPSSP